MDAIILAGGKGTRLSGIVSDLPKPLAPVGGKPFLTHILNFLNQSGKIDRIFISAGYKAECIQDWAVQSGTKNLTVLVENEPLGTGGALLHVLDIVATTDTLLVMNGDSLMHLDLAALIEAHEQSDCAVTMAVTQIADVSASGEVVISNDRIVAFREKSSDGHPGWINAGIYLIKKMALAPMPRVVSSLEYNIVPELLTMGVYAYRSSAPFVDIGTPKSYAVAASILGIVEP